MSYEDLTRGSDKIEMDKSDNGQSERNKGIHDEIELVKKADKCQKLQKVGVIEIKLLQMSAQLKDIKNSVK